METFFSLSFSFFFFSLNGDQSFGRAFGGLSQHTLTHTHTYLHKASI
ncbi:hypothetical protein CGRA01v4_08998 [Colletotrichum graminicola]|nr:hypothetical protein CGRA01v4_08998 [Colletotrichum graminicola]